MGRIITNGNVNILDAIYLKLIATGVAIMSVAHTPNCGRNRNTVFQL